MYWFDWLKGSLVALSAKLHPAAIIYFNFQLLWCPVVHTVTTSHLYLCQSVYSISYVNVWLLVQSLPVISNFSALTLHCSSYYFISHSRSPFPLQQFMRSLRRKPRCLIFPLIHCYLLGFHIYVFISTTICLLSFAYIITAWLHDPNHPTQQSYTEISFNASTTCIDSLALFGKS